MNHNRSNNSLIAGPTCWELLCPCWQWCANGCIQCWPITRSNCVAFSKETVCNARAWAQQCWKSWANSYASVITEQKNCWELLTQNFDRFQTLCNNSQQHATACNRVCKRTRHVERLSIMFTSNGKREFSCTT